jgi:hypothetical protein
MLSRSFRNGSAEKLQNKLYRIESYLGQKLLVLLPIMEHIYLVAIVFRAPPGQDPT